MLKSNFFNNFFVLPILNILLVFYKFFLWFKLPGAFGWAIIGLTVFIRLLLQPFFNKQLETAKKMQTLKPHLDKLSKKHKNDPKRLQQEQLKLYQKMGINPGAGCLYLIIQMPIFIGLYRTLSLFLLNSDLKNIIVSINQVVYFNFLKISAINPWFFGFHLGLSPAKAGQWYYYFIPLITGLLQYYQTQMSLPISEKKEKPTQEEKQEKQSETDDFQKAMNTQMKYFFPIMIGWFAYTLPVGLSLYWNIFSLFSILQTKKLKVN